MSIDGINPAPLPGDTPADQPAERAAPVIMVALAILAADGTYLGIGDTLPADQVGPGQVAIPVDCDLAPGRYRWDAIKQTFLQIAQANPLSDQPAPDALVAIALGFVATRKGGATLPEPTLRWMDAFFTSIDVRDAIRNDADVIDYLRARGLIS